MATVECYCLTGYDGMLKFFQAYLEAPDNSDIRIFDGADKNSVPIWVIQLEHPDINTTVVGLQMHEVDTLVIVCDAIAKTLKEIGDSTVVTDLMTLANGLRGSLADYPATRH